MLVVPGMAQSESVFIDRPGKEFSSRSLPPAQPSQNGYDVAGQTGNGSLRFRNQNTRASQSGYPDRNRRNTAKENNPWRPDGRVYTNSQQKLRPWGGVPANAPAMQEQQQKAYGKSSEGVPRYQPYNYRYQPAPMMPQPMPGYGRYGNAWSSPYGAGNMPGYGGGGNQFFPFGSSGGIPGMPGMSGMPGMPGMSGMPGGSFW